MGKKSSQTARLGIYKFSGYKKTSPV